MLAARRAAYDAQRFAVAGRSEVIFEAGPPGIREGFELGAVDPALGRVETIGASCSGRQRFGIEFALAGVGTVDTFEGFGGEGGKK